MALQGDAAPGAGGGSYDSLDLARIALDDSGDIAPETGGGTYSAFPTDGSIGLPPPRVNANGQIVFLADVSG